MAVKVALTIALLASAAYGLLICVPTRAQVSSSVPPVHLSGSDFSQARGTTTNQQQGANLYTETVLYSFCSQTNCADGFEPYAGLIEDASGNFYGTTSLGGAIT